MIPRPKASPCTIGEVCDFESGNGFRPQDWKATGLPIIRIQNLNGSDSFNYFDGEPEPAWIVEPNDLLFAWAGVKGVSFGPTIWNGPKGVLNQHIYRIRPKKGINKRWLYYALSEVTAEIESKAHGFKTSLVHVRKADITRARISLPGEFEQEAVATLLGCWDTAIQKTEQLIAAKERLLAHFRDQLLRRPERASSTKLLDVTRELTARNGTALGRDAIMAVTKQFGMRPMREETIAARIERYKRVPPRAFAYNPMRLNIGSIAVSPFDHEVLVSPDYVVFACDESRLLSGYLHHLRFTRLWKNHFELAGSGSVRVRIYYDDLGRFAFELPPIEIQQGIVSFLDATAHEITLLRKHSEALYTQKRGLMQKLLTGQWRLPTPKITEVPTDA
jgi:type I restriction enzyme S subunit